MNTIRARHSVRQYKDLPIEQDKRDILIELVTKINKENNLNIQIIFDDKDCFDSFGGHYGHFSGVNSYISMVGKKSRDLDEKVGYFGEEIVLKAQEIGLNTCWVGLTYGKTKSVINKGEKEVLIISLGYGVDQGRVRKSKAIEKVSNYKEGMPEWFKEGVEASLLAPSAINQQKFRLDYIDGEVYGKRYSGPFSKVDYGIIKYHFERVTGHKVNRR